MWEKRYAIFDWFTSLCERKFTLLFSVCKSQYVYNKLPHIWKKNVAHLKKCGTLEKMGHTWKNAAHFEKFAIFKKNAAHLEKCSTFGKCATVKKKCGVFGKMRHIWKKQQISKFATFGKMRHTWENVP